MRWLLLPAEERELRRLDDPARAMNFVERFWARRDPDPATPGNPFRERFAKRVEDADLLYAEEELRGSLTDRGRALILLGPPSHLRVSSQEALVWDPRQGDDQNVRVRQLPLEIWTYRPEDLPRPLALALAAEGERERYRVSFVEDGGRATLDEGEEILELASRTALAVTRE